MNGRLAVLALLLPGSLAAQQVRTAILPHDITVGDVFQVVVQVAPVTAGTVVFPDSLALPADLETAGRRLVRQDTTTAGVRWSAVYPVTAWRPGQHALPAAAIRLTRAGQVLSAVAAFPAVVIRSVLPADTAGIQPQPPHDVVGGNRVWWPWLLLAALLAIAAAAALYWYRRHRHRPRPAAPIPAVSLRDTALRALAAARSSGALEAGDFKRFYSDVSGALRTYVAALDPALGTDLTTTELARALHTRGREAGTAELLAVLHAADLVKFARHGVTHAVALADWERAWSWADGYEPGGNLAQAA